MIDKIKAYTSSGAYPFHMPGHKRTAHPELPFSFDMTEIDGFDNLHHPQGCIREIEKKAAALYRAKRAFLLVNGATAGIFAAMKAMTKRGDTVIIARNCHTSVHRAVELLGLHPVYYIPDPPMGEKEYDVYGGVNPFVLDMMLQNTPGVKLVVITSPTYEGICSDLEWIAPICHRNGAKLLVDEAHGAHFPFHDSFPKNAIAQGADCSVVSLHKTMPALTQTALLLSNDETKENELQEALAFFQTSSPSYVLMSSIDYALDFAAGHPSAFDEYLKRIDRFEKAARQWKHLELLFHGEEEIGNIADYDRGKLVVSTVYTDITGTELANILRKNYKTEIEMAAANYLIAMTSVCDTDEGFRRLSEALTAIDSTLSDVQDTEESTLLFDVPKRALDPCDCAEREAYSIPWKDAAGHITHEDVYAYPPGIPVLVKGEIISEEAVNLIDKLIQRQINILSSRNSLPESLLVSDL